MDLLVATIHRIGERALTKFTTASVQDGDPTAWSRELQAALVAAADAGELVEWSIASGVELEKLDCRASLASDGTIAVHGADKLAADIRAIQASRVLASGSTVAQTVLGTRILFGAGMPIDHDMAFQLLSRAARSGARRAVMHLAGMYARGQGTTLDLVEAARLYERAARAGEFLAQIALGRLYSDGTLPVDLERARHWYLAAVAQQEMVADCEELQEAKAFLARQS
jgi:TPR repeat protein